MKSSTSASAIPTGEIPRRGGGEAGRGCRPERALLTTTMTNMVCPVRAMKAKNWRHGSLVGGAGDRALRTRHRPTVTRPTTGRRRPSQPASGFEPSGEKHEDQYECGNRATIVAQRLALPIPIQPLLFGLTGKTIRAICSATNSRTQADAIVALARRYFAASPMMMDLSVEAEAFGARSSSEDDGCRSSSAPCWDRLQKSQRWRSVVERRPVPALP